MLQNGEFTGSLGSWTTSGTVFNTGDAAVFSDSVATPTSIFQSAAVPGGLSVFDLSFDVFNGLSSSASGGFVPDAFFATLYRGTQDFGPTLAGGTYDQALALFDMDSSGGYNLANGASFGPSPKGAEWTRFVWNSLGIPGFDDPGHLTLAFEFYNLNGTGSDSVVAIDNVLLTGSVPEPSRFMLLLIAAAGATLRRHRYAS